MSGSDSRLSFTHLILGQYDGHYYYDQQTGYIFVKEPHWFERAYSEAISSMDTGILARNISNIHIISECLTENGHHSINNGVDLGAGCGIFVRGMRDIGVEFFWSDKYADNILAKGFEAQKGSQYSIAVAFEVLEHLPNPILFLQQAREEFNFHTCFFPPCALMSTKYQIAIGGIGPLRAVSISVSSHSALCCGWQINWT
jgi:hypothetical protein